MTFSPPGGTGAPPVSATRDLHASAVASDMLYGADEIALFLFGDRKHRRRVYNLVQGDALPTFRIGVSICARRSVLTGWIGDQESRKRGSCG